MSYFPAILPHNNSSKPEGHGVIHPAYGTENQLARFASLVKQPGDACAPPLGSWMAAALRSCGQFRGFHAQDGSTGESGAWFWLYNTGRVNFQAWNCQ